MKDIGSIIINEAEKQKISMRQLAKKANISAPGLYRMLKKKDFKISWLLLYSQILNHDFFQYYRTGLAYLPEDYQQLKLEYQQLKQQLETLQRENDLLRDFVQVLKSQSK